MPPTPLRQEDYLAIEAAVMETARGRWFLSEYARRNRNADTDTLLTAIDKLEKSVTRERAPASLMHRVKMDLADMAAAIERTKLEIAQIKHEDNEGAERFERASSELDAIVSQTESATGDILGAAEKIQEFAWTLREQGAAEETCDSLDMEATNIYMACSFQDLTGQRIKKIVDAMRYVEKRINSMIDIWGFESDSVEIDHTDAKSHDERPDAHLLNGPALEGEGVCQNRVDDLFDQVPDSDEADQDDVDALFGQGQEMNAEAIDEIEFDSCDFSEVSAEDEALDVEASLDAVGEVDFVEAEGAAPEAVADANTFVDMEDLDWAEKQDEQADEVASAELVQEETAELGEADVFAAASDAVSENEAVAEATPAEALEGDADVFAGVDLDSVEADVFANADPADSVEDIKQAALMDRVAEFS